MSDSVKKLVQKKLPFAVISSEKSPAAASKPTENLSPNVSAVSRKRKTSAELENVKAKKRVTESKEKLVVTDVVELSDDEKGAANEDVKNKSSEKSTPKSETQKTPTSTTSGKGLHIKLPASSKKRKINMETKPAKARVEEDDDDSVVYLDDEDISSISIKKLKKSGKKSEKNKKKSSKSAADDVKKLLNLSVTEKEQPEANSLKTDNEVSQEKQKVAEQSTADQESNKNDGDVIVGDDLPSPSACDGRVDEMQGIAPIAGTYPPADIMDAFDKTSPADESINDELIEMLSDESSSSSKKTSPNADGSFTTPSSKLDYKNLTPKQQARRQEQLERRTQKELQRQKERELKEQQRLKEKEARDDAKRREKEEKEEARKKEKEDRDRKRQAEQDKKDEEKRVKEDERKRIIDQREEEKRVKEEERKRQVELREEEKRKREEAAKKKETEEEIRKKRAAENFSKFFFPKKKISEATVIEDETSKDSNESADSVGVVKSNFMPFQIREGMKVAPLVRRVLSKDEQKNFDKSFNVDLPKPSLYLADLKSGSHVPLKSTKIIWPVEEKDDDVMIVDELQGAGEDIKGDETKIYRAKRLLFVENRRPAYFGTWRKKSSTITARRPLAVDTKFFDYEVDSDEEWEEEEPGESLHGSDSEKEKDKDGEEDDYEVDNDFFVPHGHLSDEEMQQNDDDTTENNHPEAQKAKLKILQQEFAAEMKKKTEKIKPRLIGCIWMNGDEDENGCSKSDGSDKKFHCSDIIWRILKAREMMVSSKGIKLQDDFEPEIAKPEEDVEKTSAAKIQARAKFSDDTCKILINLLHGNTNSKKFLIKEFQAHCLKNFPQGPEFLEFSIKTVGDKIQEISDYRSCPDDGLMFGKKCWYVKPDVLQNLYGESKKEMPNSWVYTLEKSVKDRKPKNPTNVDGAKQEASKEKGTVEATPGDDDVIMLEENEEKTAVAAEIKPKKKKVELKKADKVEPTTKPKTPPKAKKRVQLLMSVPRGEEIPQTKKNNLISQYLKGSQPAVKVDEPKVVEEVITID